MAPKKHQLPKRIYVNLETDDSDPSSSWLNAHDTPDAIDDGMQVGVYELKETRTKLVSHELK